MSKFVALYFMLFAIYATERGYEIMPNILVTISAGAYVHAALTHKEEKDYEKKR